MVTFDIQSLLQTFFEEAEEHLATFEQGLLELASSGGDGASSETIARMFRAAHSIKGAGGTFGLDDIAGFTHALETLFDRLRQGELQYDATLGKTLLASLDMLKLLVQNARTGEPAPAGMQALKAALLGFAPEAAAEAVESADVDIETASGERRVTVVFQTKPAFMSRGMDPLRIVRELRALGAVESCVLDTSKVPPLEELDPTSMYLSWTIVLLTTSSDAEIADVFSFIDDLCTFEVKPERAATGATAVVEAAHAEASPADAAASRGQAGARAPAHAESPTIRVATDKIDKLLDLVGELVIAQAMVVEAARQDPATLGDALTAMERHTRELQERVMSIRMVPLSTVFRRFPRLVHDTAQAVGKKVRLDIQGEGTEIDKSMVEKLVDPLTHLVRNAIDHGLEVPEDRVARGKGDEGTVTLSALHQGGNVVIEVADDGRGLDTERIRAKAERLGLLAPDAPMSDEAIHEFIFHAGFSTAAVVSDLSGRGVGMDVVKRNVELLNGSLTLASEPGRGTRLRLRLPLTLAILDGLAVRVGSQTFILPLLSVVESFRPVGTQVRKVFGLPEVIDVRGTSIPIVRLRDTLGVPDGETDPTKALVCVVETNGGQVALLVDEVLGQLQVVVKSLEVNFRKVDGVMGATILGDGRVALIVDVQALSRTQSPSRGDGPRAPRALERSASFLEAQ